MSRNTIDRAYRVMAGAGPWSTLGKVARLIIEQQRNIDRMKG